MNTGEPDFLNVSGPIRVQIPPFEVAQLLFLTLGALGAFCNVVVRLG